MHGALNDTIPCLLLYAFEPILLTDEHYSSRHFNFIRQSLNDLNKKLSPLKTKILIVSEDIINCLKKIENHHRIIQIFSHQETGIAITFKRDKKVASFCKSQGIGWKQYIQNGVVRGLNNRKGWRENWENYMSQPQKSFSAKASQFLNITSIRFLEREFKAFSTDNTSTNNMQPGGESTGRRYLESFFKLRYFNYQKHISKPDLARVSCSRLSPFIAWGNLSMREVVQRAAAALENKKHGFALQAFSSRLRWQAHFIQKFEMEYSMEFQSVNQGYHKINKTIDPIRINAWENGKTGVPIVDAAMRCLVATGYLNFRMRALVVSFFVHQLWQPWQAASAFLARQFLDFEPGIHYPQLQMQAGETGINTLRIYNPVKNGIEHDPKGAFVKKWVPELQNVPAPFVQHPWKLTALEQSGYGFASGIDYPLPIVNLEESRKHAGDILWNMQKNKLVRQESQRILKRHTLPNRKSIQ